MQPTSQSAVVQLASVAGCPRKPAEEALATARRQGDRHGEVAALTDLGLIELNQKNIAGAVTEFKEALSIARSMASRVLLGDILLGLGQATLIAERPPEALTHLQEAIAIARGLGDCFLEKLVLERLGYVYRNVGDRARCLGAFHEALAIARDVGDRLHEASLLWLLAIAHAELGERETTVECAQASVEVLKRAGNPQASWYAEQLRKYLAGESSEQLPGQSALDASMFGEVLIAIGTQRPETLQRSAQDPGILRMAVTATQAMMRFLGSGLKTVSQSELERRLRTCAACPHYTGLRCRLCGCFTNVKARLPYEECPVGKWEAARSPISCSSE